MKSPYLHADKAIRRMNRYMEAAFQNLFVQTDFDELNLTQVKTAVSGMYARIRKEAKDAYREIVKAVILDAEKETGRKQDDLDDLLIVAAVLERYDPVTKYVYGQEWTRKRDRLTESIMSSQGRQEARVAFQRALRLLAGQVAQYADNMTEEARKECFRQAGCENVMWHTQHDSGVCGKCAERDGQIYPLGRLPARHYKCRCYFTAVRN